eukprot:TRINITY_DN80611_c0_g1_i1.p1 TRINITY_DN80611_c0_g1~~TRINITY_DN80611_c0_g1_i1.p1  ORF type:complete len:659 (-),score=139.84 TRINITY_DN80611_c0_g1_i1:53-2029(-)
MTVLAFAPVLSGGILDGRIAPCANLQQIARGIPVANSAASTHQNSGYSLAPLAVASVCVVASLKGRSRRRHCVRVACFCERSASHSRSSDVESAKAKAAAAFAAAALLLAPAPSEALNPLAGLLSSWEASGEEQVKQAWRNFAKPQWQEALRLDDKARWRKVSTKVLAKIREVARLLSELQSDLYSEDWDVIGIYPQVFRAYVDMFTKYTDSAFDGKGAVDKSLRFELRYEVGQFYKGVGTLEGAVAKKDGRLAQFAFAEMSLSYDRYLKAGDLYEGAESVVNTETLYRSRDGSELKIKYEPPVLEPPQIRDEVTIITGPDKGKLGQVLWIGSADNKPKFSIVKLGYNPSIGVEEVKSFPYEWIARTESTGEKFVIDASAAFIASVLACTVVYPIDTAKVRMQGGEDPIPSAEEGGPLAMYDGLVLNLGREAPNASISIGIFHYLTRVLLAALTPFLSPFFDMNNPAARYTVMLPAAAIGDAVGTVVRVPFELLNKQIQSGAATTTEEAVEKVFFTPGASQLVAASWTSILFRDVPYGTLYLTFFEIAKDNLAVAFTDLTIPQFAQEAIWGLLAAYTAALITIPFDVVATRVITQLEGDASKDADITKTLDLVVQVTKDVWDEEGVSGFFVGAQARAIYYGFCGAIFWSIYETLLKVL